MEDRGGHVNRENTERKCGFPGKEPAGTNNEEKESGDGPRKRSSMMKEELQQKGRGIEEVKRIGEK